MKWHPVCRIEEVPEWGSRKVRADGIEIGLFRLRDGRLFAIENACPHKAGPLSEGIVSGDCIICPLHYWKISLITGEAQAPDTGKVCTFPVKIEDGQVWIDLTNAPSVSKTAHDCGGAVAARA